MVQANPPYPFRPATSGEARAVIAGGGPVGLTLALGLAQHGIASILLEEDATLSTGSRAICWAQRTLEIFGRLGLGPRFLAKGVTWNRGRVFHRDREAYGFDLLPEQGHEYPAFINLPQYHAEAWLVEACAATGLVDLRWRHRIASVEHRPTGALLAIETPAGPYALHTEWLLACDGARSTIRRGLGLPFLGQAFDDRFLIADVTMPREASSPWPAERRFWFDPPFHPGQSVLLHQQPDDLWRIDFQLGPEADPALEQDPARVRTRIAAMLGPATPFEIAWISLYTFRCRRLERFRHGRTLFLGDAAHQVSPFGARGGNGGVQDADNLAWKLAAHLQGRAPEALLDSYEAERIPAADENILEASRSADFISPKTPACRAWRDAVLELAAEHAFARPLVNSGRLSRPAVLAGSPLSTPDTEPWPGALPLGSPAIDAPVTRAGQPGWLLHHLGPEPVLLAFAGPGVPAPEAPPGLRRVTIAADGRVGAPVGTLWDQSGLAAARHGASPGDALLLRPDQHLAARFRQPTPAAIAAALSRSLGNA